MDLGRDSLSFYLKITSEFGWTAHSTLEDMSLDSWDWQKNNPNGYE